jgi:hypothetical protein
MSVLIGSKLEAQQLQCCFFPLPEVIAVWSWPPIQTPLTARSRFLSGQWFGVYVRLRHIPKFSEEYRLKLWHICPCELLAKQVLKPLTLFPRQIKIYLTEIYYI